MSILRRKRSHPAAPITRTYRSGGRAFCAVFAASLAALGAIVASPPAAAQTCAPAWTPTFGGTQGVGFQDGADGVLSAAVFDDGSGPALYVGGNFGPAGGVVVNDIAKWDGQRWSALGNGAGLSAPFGGGNSYVSSLIVFDDGSGPALYAGGEFTAAGGASANNIAKWDGQSWSRLGSGLTSTGAGFQVNALIVFDDGTGSALYATGLFDHAGGVPVTHIAKWDGQSWSPLGLGSGLNNRGRAMTVFNDGAGTALYVAGSFTAAGGIAANHIAKWDGQSWSPMGAGVGNVGGIVDALTVFDDGTGPALYAGGAFFTFEGATNIVKWDGVGWRSLGGIGIGVDNHSQGVKDFVVFNDGTGSALYATGVIRTAGGVSVNGIAKWDGLSWSPLGTGLHNSNNIQQGRTGLSLAVFDDGSGLSLFVGGTFPSAGSQQAKNIAKWNGQLWFALGGGGMDGKVNALGVFDDGAGAALYAGGTFLTASGGVSSNSIARWDGVTWSPLGNGMAGGLNPGTSTDALAVFNDGTGQALYAGGNFTAAGGASANNIAKWDGSSWSPLGTGIDGTVNALLVFDDGTGRALYAGGHFTAAGGASANNIAKWDGSSWSPLGTGVNDSVNSLAIFNDGTGPVLYAGGRFRSPSPNGIAKWDGQSWLSVGGGLIGHGGGNTHDPHHTPAEARVLMAFDDGSGPQLYVGGMFLAAGDAGGTNSIARWDGLSWAQIPLGSGLSSGAQSMQVFDDGSGLALYFDGRIRWDGSSWTGLERVFGQVVSMVGFDDGSGLSLFVGGNFPASPAGDSFLAKYQGCPPPHPHPADTNGDGVIDGADLANLFSGWGPCLIGGSCRTDLNSDGIVDATDLAFLLANWG